MVLLESVSLIQNPPPDLFKCLYPAFLPTWFQGGLQHTDIILVNLWFGKMDSYPSVVCVVGLFFIWYQGVKQPRKNNIGSGKMYVRASSFLLPFLQKSALQAKLEFLSQKPGPSVTHSLAVILQWIVSSSPFSPTFVKKISGMITGYIWALLSMSTPKEVPFYSVVFASRKLFLELQLNWLFTFKLTFTTVLLFCVKQSNCSSLRINLDSSGFLSVCRHFQLTSFLDIILIYFTFWCWNVGDGQSEKGCIQVSIWKGGKVESRLHSDQENFWGLVL